MTMAIDAQSNREKLDLLDKYLKKILGDIEKGIWGGQKVAAWNCIAFPYGRADETILNELKATYQKCFFEFDEIQRTLINFSGSQRLDNQEMIHRIEKVRNRLIDFCTTARTGIPYTSHFNRNEIRCLDIPNI